MHAPPLGHLLRRHEPDTIHKNTKNYRNYVLGLYDIVREKVARQSIWPAPSASASQSRPVAIVEKSRSNLESQFINEVVKVNREKGAIAMIRSLARSLLQQPIVGAPPENHKVQRAKVFTKSRYRRSAGKNGGEVSAAIKYAQAWQ